MKHLWIGSVAILIASHASVAQTQQPNVEAMERAELVLATEEVIETLRAQMATLAHSAKNLSIPDVGARELFADRVSVRGLAPASSADREDVLDLDVHRWSWPLAEGSTDTSAGDLQLWSSFLGSVDFLHHAKFFTRRGTFQDDGQTRFLGVSGFKALAQMPDGELAYVKAELDILWGGDAAARGVGWRVYELHTRSFKVIETDQPLFLDVLEDAVDDGARRRARDSRRDDALTQWIVDIGRGELSLEQAISDQLVGQEDGTLHMHMSHVSVVDLDGDGFDDFYVLPSDAMPLFFRNRGDGSFEEIAAEINLAHYQAEAATFADFDNDGDPDLFLSFFPGQTRYLANEGGRFVDRTDQSETPFPELSIAMSPMDYDGDGLLDIYFCRYNGAWLGVMAARWEAALESGETVDPSFPGMNEEESAQLFQLLFSAETEPFINRPGPPNRLYRNLGDGSFEPARVPAVEQYTQSMAATWSDFDLDGDMDLYIVTEAAPNQLARNNGDGTFTDVSDAITADVGFGMGLGIGDYDNDGRQDVYVTNMYSKAGLRISDQMGANELIRGSARGNSLLRNGVDGWERVSGVKKPKILVEAADFGWGGAFADFNNDGILDLYAPAGFITVPPAVESVGET